MSSLKKMHVRIVLPGGGVKASFQAGFLSEMIRSGLFEIDKVYGCSAGALLAPFVACDKVDLLIDQLMHVTALDENILTPWTRPSSSTMRNIFTFLYDKFQSIITINEYISQIFSIVHLYFDLGLYKQLAIVDTWMKLLTSTDKKIVAKKVEVVAWDILNKKNTWFSGSQVFAGVHASSAIWMAVPPYKIKDSFYCDGGATQLYPLDALDPNYDGYTIMVDLDTRENKPDKKLPANAVIFAYGIVSAMMMEQADTKLRHVQSQLKKKFILIRPDQNYFNHALDIRRDASIMAINGGRLKFKEFLLQHSHILRA